jgi:sporadic carbohydrate cluster protein (TIGR04323 family)
VRDGYRGYIASRPVNGAPYPHKVQNLVIRDYAARKKLHFLLSATEVAVPDSYMMLNDLLARLDQVNGIILFSQFMLPREAARRREIYDRILAAGCELHAALEETALTRAADIDAFESVLTITPHLAATPFAGRFPPTASESTGATAAEVRSLV